MKVPTTGTSVFAPIAVTPTAGSSFTTNFPFDSSLLGYRLGNDGGNWTFIDRLRGYANASGDGQPVLRTSSTGAEFAAGTIVYNTNNTGGLWGSAYAGLSDIFYFLRRAPGFFDEVCYTGTQQPVKNHNLNAVPELVIVKQRNTSAHWYVKHKDISNLGRLATANSFFESSTLIYDLTKTTFSVDFVLDNGSPGQTYVAYLFATCAGVSKVGSYTGTGTTLQINCGFTAGARFVMIKRADPVGTFVADVGGWFVWDTARGIVSSNDPYLLLNSTAAEVTNTDYIDPVSSGFEISSTAPAAINASGGTFIFLAIA
jgi:hypothetical protein